MFGCGLFARIKRMCGYCLYETAVLHAFESDEPVGELLYLSGFAMHYQHLKA